MTCAAWRRASQAQASAGPRLDANCPPQARGRPPPPPAPPALRPPWLAQAAAPSLPRALSRSAAPALARQRSRAASTSAWEVIDLPPGATQAAASGCQQGSQQGSWRASG